MSITTKTGDKGQTSLYTGQRVGKDSLRVNTYGTIDELDSALALARAFVEKDEVAKRVRSLQKNISLLMADFASVGKDSLITAEHVARIEQAIADLEEELPEQRSFIVPGDTKGGAMLDLARTTARRAERMAHRLAREEDVPAPAMVYLNRISDYCYLLMRLEEDVFSSGDDE